MSLVLPTSDPCRFSGDITLSRSCSYQISEVPIWDVQLAADDLHVLQSDGQPADTNDLRYASHKAAAQASLFVLPQNMLENYIASNAAQLKHTIFAHKVNCFELRQLLENIDQFPTASFSTYATCGACGRTKRPAVMPQQPNPPSSLKRTAAPFAVNLEMPLSLFLSLKSEARTTAAPPKPSTFLKVAERCAWPCYTTKRSPHSQNLSICFLPLKPFGFQLDPCLAFTRQKHRHTLSVFSRSQHCLQLHIDSNDPCNGLQQRTRP